ncbi:hypothetical protein ACQ4PT_008836 [Festuca glaucescens]
MEPYFREMTLDDFEALLPSVSNRLDPCFIIPFVGSGKEHQSAGHVDPSHAAVVAENSNPNVALGKENEEPENCRAHVNHATQHESSDFVGRSSVKLVSSNGDSEEHRQQDVILQQEAVTQLDPGKSLDDSLNWLLGARGRFVLTSERPNKKRKLLGADAGLERLVWLPPLPGETASTCDVCCLGESDAASNRMLHCNSCKVSVHQKCYGVQVVPDGYWTCAWCDGISSARRLTLNDEGRIVSMPCVLCPKEKGALKPVKCDPAQTADGGNPNFAHLFCSLWAPEVFVEDMDSMEPVTNIGDIPENRTKMVCTLCKVMHGACVRCSHGTCRACFHPICARESKHQMEIWGKSGLKNVELRIFCSRHSRVRSISSVHNANGVTEQDTARVGLDDEIFTTDKKQQMRFTRKSKDKFMNGISISSSSSSLNKVQTAELVTTPCTARAIETQQIEQTHMVVDQPTGDGNLVSSSTDVSAVLRKLIDQGKVSVGDIESELGLSSESLEAALVPETTTFSPGLKLKIIKLLQNSVHVSSVQVKPLKESYIAPEGTLLRSESKNLTDSQPGSELEEGISSFDHNYPDSDKADKDWSNSVENSSHTGRDCEDDHISGQRVLNIDGYRCYIHPYVEKKLQDLWGHISNQNKQSCYHVEELSCVPHDQNLADLSTKLEQLTEIAAADQASKAESSDILEHSPRDEIEGEIIYFQSRLLNDVVSKNQRYEDLKFKVVQSLSHELDSFNKRKWDHIIVNQFLRDIREAKKRGNTERRHKEAQAILAAAAPCAAPSLRNETFKKEAENDAAPVKQEVDSQQYGPEEVKIMKQMRVELERLRLLCERIVKREKEKKELVVCEHDILAVRRDYVASSIQTPCYMSGTGASSESATTSVNNNSYSGKRQRSDEVTVRSDDVTVDSTISRKNTVRFPIHSKDTDRNTADSSTSTISYKQKLDDGELLADKNLQERAVVASQKSGDGETKNSSTSTISYKRKLDDGEILADKNLQERAVTASQKSGDGETKNSSTSTISYKRKLDDGELLADKNLQGGEVIASQKSGDGETKSIDKKYGETVQNELVATCDQAMSLKPCDQAMSLNPCDQAMSQKQVPPKRYVYTRKKKQRIQDVVQVPGNA